MSATIAAVTFDCWQTLLHDRDMTRPVGLRVDALVRASDGRLDFNDATELIECAWRRHHEVWVGGSHYGSEGMARWCLEAAGVDGDLEAMAAELACAFEEAALHGEVEALPGASEGLRALRAAGLRTALVCDTGFSSGRVVRKLLARAGLTGLLDVLVFSNEVGVPKPNPRMFRTALEGVGAEPRQAVHVGDLRRTDVAGARAAGMKTVRIAATHDDPALDGLPEADEVVGSHAELPDALRRLGAPL